MLLRHGGSIKSKIYDFVFFMLFVVFAIFTQNTYAEGKDVMNKYRWYPSESAFKEYPMEIVSGSFDLSDGGFVRVPNGKIFNNGWGRGKSTNIIGDDFKSIPVKLKITWFSYVENKFYNLECNLFHEKILRLFSDGFKAPVTNEKTNYNRVVIGLAPGGRASLWLTGEGISTEVESFKGQEALIKWSEIIKNTDISREEYIEMVLEESLGASLNSQKKKKIDFWNLYRQRRVWQLEILGGKPIAAWINFYNGEAIFLKTGDLKKIFEKVPRGLKFNWMFVPKGNKYTANITLNEEEIFQAYKRMDLDKKISFQLKLDRTSKSIEVFLKSGKVSVLLERSEIKIYKME